jgi:predicted N-formylglutamate amidohydrolase
MPRPLKIFVSCEHASNRVPKPYQHLFAGREAVLDSHRGYDLGILPFAEMLAAEFNSPLISADVTRLIVDLNRSLDSKNLFSEFTRVLPPSEKEEIIRRYHQPYWRAIENIVAGMIASNQQVLHLSVHSFTPSLHGKIRNADLGLLYDPARRIEKTCCLQWQQALVTRLPSLRIRRNYPYRGNADALVTALRKRFAAETYLGIELEINQRIPIEKQTLWDTIQEQLRLSLRGVHQFLEQSE